MTQPELDMLMQNLRAELLKLNIPLSDKIRPGVQINTRAKRRLGCCRLKNDMYTIEVSASVTDNTEKLRETLAHELLHTCKGCDNHGELWKSYAKIVNAALGMSVQRLAPAEETAPASLRRDEIKYVLECQSCGTKIYRTRMSKAVKSPWRYRCKCGGKLAAFQIKPMDN